MNKIRVGIVGAGLQARRRAGALQGSQDAEVVVVSAEHVDSAKRLATQLGCEADVGWEWVARRQDVDAVIICTPPHIHAAATIAALRSGKHVLCEKPLARTLSEAAEMLSVAKADGRRLKCGFNHRHHPAVSRAKQWLDQGRIGEPLFIRSRYGICGRPGYEQEWRGNPLVVGGGQLMEQGIHVVDLSRWFLGEFDEVACFIGTQYWQTGSLEDNAFALFRTAQGKVASIHSSLTQWHNLFSFEVFGRDGFMAVEGLGGGYGTERLVFGPRDFSAPFAKEVVEFRGEDRSWRDEWHEFVRAIREDQEPIGDASDGIEAMRLVVAAYEAAGTGRTAKVLRGEEA